jgi:hypothetical protein
MTFQNTTVTIRFSARINIWNSLSAPNTVTEYSQIGICLQEKETEVEASRLRRYPHLLFANAINVGDLAGRATTFGLVEEGRAESLSEDVNLEDDDVTWDSKKA